MIYLQTVGGTLGNLLAMAIILSWINGRTIQHIVNVTGKSNAQLPLMKPGLWVHETAHALVGRLFGLRIQEFSVSQSADRRSAGHVTFRFKKHSLWQRLGLFFAGGAPVWVFGAVVLMIGKRAFWPGQPLALVGWGTILPAWPWALAWLVITLTLSFGASLSAADLHTTLRGMPAFAVMLLAVSGVLTLVAPSALTSWSALNVLMAWIGGLLIVIALAMNLISHLLWR
ncbi:hypothetical protein [Lacticaseibacillus camelliae]|uniref:Uncharacterized protein n=1 Tax=Lacticaseibacillus camelliae DSM 22697 = JCM 13995 TaxID=1423730 RepID=A0A0R2F7A5_9LACO|nr:hypothetical protein [Lacticaseibacillus camelliae]KRN23542.1 hypothetical protein FC75_GL001396 [Lacticaseibacillus camelliae DSM 22697 = JCM 13995]